jgi:hypothetical protein
MSTWYPVNRVRSIFLRPEIFQGTCGYGQVSDIGYETIFRNGQALHKIYGDYLSFLRSIFYELKAEDVYLRSTG